MQENELFLSIVIPAYNEQDRLAPSLKHVHDYLTSLGKPFEIVVVDDGSNDNTSAIAEEMSVEMGSIRVVCYLPNQGKGHAVRVGVAESRGKYIGFSDADLSAPIEEIHKLLEAIESGNDVAIGSRAIKGAVIPVHQPRYRELGGRALNIIIQALALPGIHDTQCGFKLFKAEVAKEVFGKCFLNGWGFDVEVLYLSRKAGYTISEVPVVWSHSEGSKIHPVSAAIKVIIDLIKMRMHRY